MIDGKQTVDDIVDALMVKFLGAARGDFSRRPTALLQDLTDKGTLVA